MKLSDYQQYVGQQADFILYPMFTVRVRVLDVKSAYGNIRYLVECLQGTGTTWIEGSNLKFESEETNE